MDPNITWPEAAVLITFAVFGFGAIALMIWKGPR